MKAEGSTTTETGYVGILTPEQEDKLRQLWTLLLDVFESDAAGREAVDPQDPAAGPRETTAPSHHEVDLDQRPSMKTWLAMLKQENPDALLLRFLRARKWDVSAAFSMLRAALDWRRDEMRVDEEVLPKGEPWCKHREMVGEGEGKEGKEGKETKDAREFLEQFRMGKVYLRGVDRHGRPVGYVHVALHNPAKQSQQTIEKLVVHFIETARTLFTPTETGKSEAFCVVFDLSGFSLSNMEWQPARFVIRAFEANYPECLGTMIIHNAPWVFSGVWKIVRALLDPVVAAKVDFTRNIADLERHIPRENIPAKFGGDDPWRFEYHEPGEDEDACIARADEREKIMVERTAIAERLLTATRTWIRQHVDAAEVTEEAEAEAQAQLLRRDAIEDLRKNYWALDPYVRSRTHLDRTGVINPGGVIDLYPERNAAAVVVVEEPIENEKAVVEAGDIVPVAQEVEVAA
ncbi:CRAL-TRIO domain-containing protein [Xylaria acuta]|nr:CRAL-TRIO domain-containing protein [Xylaria acuta]